MIAIITAFITPFLSKSWRLRDSKIDRGNKLSNKELDEFLKNCHKDLSVEDFEGKKIPCIGFEGKKFDDMLE